MARTNAEMLEEVNEAIYKIMAGGQSYTIGSRTLTRADLGQLRKLKQELMAENAGDNGSSLFGDTYVAMFSGR